MNSTKKRNCRKKVIVSRRLNLSSSRSVSLKKKGSDKRRTTALLKNNRSLAVALQDARGELSVKQKLLENAAKHFKNIMQARVLMFEMYSDLKSFVKKFDDALPLLNMDDIKISDIIVPFRSCSQFKSKMKELAESVEEVPEENSFSIVSEKVNCDISLTKSPNQIISFHHNSDVGFKATEVMNKHVDKISRNFEVEHNLPVQVCIENTSTANSNRADTIDSRPSVEFHENFEEPVDPLKEKLASPIQNDTVKIIESPGTPRLSIPSINTLNNLQVPSNAKACVSFQVPLSPRKTISEVLNTHVSSSKAKSKIPKFRDLSLTSNKESNLSGNVSKLSKISSQNTLNVSKDNLMIDRRKTFVVKNTDASSTNSESNDILGKNDIIDDNDFTTEESGHTNSRKTFVKIPDIPKDQRKSISNRRKTFVKKPSNNNKIRKSMKNRRGTFVISETKEDYITNKNVTTIAEISPCNDLVKNKCVLSERNISEEFPLICNETSQIPKNTFQENLINMDISSNSKIVSLTNQSEQVPSEDKDTVAKANKITCKQDEFKCENGSSSGVKDLHKAQNVNKKSFTHESVELSDICGTAQKCAQPVMPDKDDVEILEVNNIHAIRYRRRPSYKMFLEDSSESDFEIIPDLELDALFVKEPPFIRNSIRKQISESRKEKVFVFGAPKRKLVQTKKSLSKVRKKSIKEADFLQESSTDIKNEDVITKFSICELSEKNKKCVSEDISNNKRNSHEDSETSYNEQQIVKCAATDGKDTETFKCVTNENLKKQVELSVSKSGEKVIKNSLSLFNSPVVASHKFLNAIECESEDIDCGDKKGNKICKIKTKSKKESSKSGKNSKVKKDPLKDCSVDSISVKKSTKRNNSRKQSEQTITSDVGQINKGNTLPLKNETQEKRTRGKNKTKGTTSKKKSPASVPNSNTIVVQAEVHSPPPEYISKTASFNKENKLKHESENCSVILKDIFKPTSIDVLSLSCKDKIVSKGRNIPLKIPLSDNSSNILSSGGGNHDVKNEENNASDVQDIRSSKRLRNVNYSEPNLRKKLRR